MEKSDLPQLLKPSSLPLILSPFHIAHLLLRLLPTSKTSSMYAYPLLPLLLHGIHQQFHTTIVPQL